MESLPSGIAGLDLVLGGGISIVRRSDGSPASAIVLLRGPPGSGKSVFGTQLAGAVARDLKCDVAYGCVELLPRELQEQHDAFGRGHERVILPPFPQKPPPFVEGGCRIFASLLDLGEPGSERAAFGGAVIELLDAVEQVGGKKPGVLVIDSLSDGYGLGASVPRVLADQLCKVAADRGMILILLEETVDGRPSPWSFASDIVLELEAQAEDQAPDMPAPVERRITVTKNRFAPSDAGPHRFTIERKRGVELLPRPSAYLAEWAKNIVLPPPREADQSWNLPQAFPEAKLPKFRRSVTAVYGSDSAHVFKVTTMVGASGGHGVDVLIDFGHGLRSSGVPEIAATNPFLSGNRLLADAIPMLDKNLQQGVRRVVIGDFRSLRKHWNPDGIRRAVGVLVAILRRVEIPVVLFETTSGRSITAAQQIGWTGAADNEEPAIVDLADVHIEIAINVQPHALVTYVRGGYRSQFEIEPLKS